jgi:hypothetical protein
MHHGEIEAAYALSHPIPRARLSPSSKASAPLVGLRRRTPPISLKRAIQRSPFSSIWIVLLTKTSVVLVGKAG